MTISRSKPRRGKPIPRDPWVWQREMSGILDYLERPFDPGIGRSRAWWSGQVKYYLSRCDVLLSRVPRKVRDAPVYDTLQERVQSCRTRLKPYLSNQ